MYNKEELNSVLYFYACRRVKAMFTYYLLLLWHISVPITWLLEYSIIAAFQRMFPENFNAPKYYMLGVFCVIPAFLVLILEGTMLRNR